MPNLTHYTVFDGRTPIITGTLKQLKEWAQEQGYEWADFDRIQGGDKRLEVKLVQTTPDGRPGVHFYDPEEFVFVQLGDW